MNFSFHSEKDPEALDSTCIRAIFHNAACERAQVEDFAGFVGHEAERHLRDRDAVG